MHLRRLDRGPDLLARDEVQLLVSGELKVPPVRVREVRARLAAEGFADEPAAQSFALVREATRRVLIHPAVADKTFLIAIGDRTVGGLICRDQMVGPWQVPVADCAVTLADYQGYAGVLLAVAERVEVGHGHGRECHAANRPRDRVRRVMHAGVHPRVGDQARGQPEDGVGLARESAPDPVHAPVDRARAELRPRVVGADDLRGRRRTRRGDRQLAETVARIFSRPLDHQVPLGGDGSQTRAGISGCRRSFQACPKIRSVVCRIGPPRPFAGSLSRTVGRCFCRCNPDERSGSRVWGAWFPCTGFWPHGITRLALIPVSIDVVPCGSIVCVALVVLSLIARAAGIPTIRIPCIWCVPTVG